MRADSFAGQVIAVLSRRASAFELDSTEPQTFPGRLRALLSRRRRINTTSFTATDAGQTTAMDEPQAEISETAESHRLQPAPGDSVIKKPHTVITKQHVDRPPAATPPHSRNPILNERPVQRFEFLHRRPQTKARVALVIATARGDYHVYAPQHQPTIGELIWANIRTLYEVDMGLHQTRIEAELPSAGDMFFFQAVLDVHWRVQDPLKIVIDGITDVREALLPSLLARLRRVTRTFDIEQVAQAEHAIQNKLEDELIGVEFGLWTSILPRLTVDGLSRHYVGATCDINRDTEVEKLTQELRLMREEHNKVLLEGRVNRYREIIAAGDLDQFALQLARHPDDVLSIVSMLKDDRDTNRRQTIDFITRLIESDAIDQWEIDDQVKSALQWLKTSTHQVISNHLEEPLQLPPERTRNRLDSPKLPNPPLSGHTDSDKDPTTGRGEGPKDAPS